MRANVARSRLSSETLIRSIPASFIAGANSRNRTPLVVMVSSSNIPLLRCRDKARTLAGAIPADRLARESREERASDAKNDSQDEAGGIIRSRQQHARDDAGDETDHDDPQQT